MTPADLRAWQASMGLNNAEAHEALGVSRSAYYAWLAGERELGDLVDWACAAVAAGLEPYSVQLARKNNKNILCEVLNSPETGL